MCVTICQKKKDQRMFYGQDDGMGWFWGPSKMLYIEEAEHGPGFGVPKITNVCSHREVFCPIARRCQLPRINNWATVSPWKLFFSKTLSFFEDSVKMKVSQGKKGFQFFWLRYSPRKFSAANVFATTSYFLMPSILPSGHTLWKSG